MTLIQTTFFQLATIMAGDQNAAKVAFVLPGRLDTKDYIHVTSLIEKLGQHGYLAVSFDPPGTWESPGSIELFSTTNYIKAVQDMIGYFGNRPTVLIGHSRGGAVAALVGSTYREVESIVMICANYGVPTPPDPTTIVDGRQKSYRDLPPGNRRTEHQQEFSLSLNYFEDGKQYNPVETLRNCTKPKLLLQGTVDEFTSVSEVQSIFNSLPDPKRLELVQAEHDYRLDSQALHRVNDLVLDFLAAVPQNNAKELS